MTLANISSVVLLTGQIHLRKEGMMMKVNIHLVNNNSKGIMAVTYSSCHKYFGRDNSRMKIKIYEFTNLNPNKYT